MLRLRLISDWNIDYITTTESAFTQIFFWSKNKSLLFLLLFLLFVTESISIISQNQLLAFWMRKNWFMQTASKPQAIRTRAKYDRISDFKWHSEIGWLFIEIKLPLWCKIVNPFNINVVRNYRKEITLKWCLFYY